ncbi:MAG: acetyltransferase [Pirellulaceae bacterium]
MSTTLCVFGGKSTALEIAETARRFMSGEFSRVVLVVPEAEPADGASRLHIAELRELVRTSPDAVGYLISMWDQNVRQEWLQAAEGLGMVPCSVVHPSAYVSDTARVGKGVYLAANVIVSVNAVVADHVIVNYSCTVGHDSVIGSHSFLNPGARLSGNVTIGDRVLIGSNAFVFQGLSIANDSLIDAMTYVDRNIESNMICSSKQLRVHKRVF